MITLFCSCYSSSHSSSSDESWNHRCYLACEVTTVDHSTKQYIKESLPYCRGQGKVREFHLVWKMVTLDLSSVKFRVLVTYYLENVWESGWLLKGGKFFGVVLDSWQLHDCIACIRYL